MSKIYCHFKTTNNYFCHYFSLDHVNKSINKYKTGRRCVLDVISHIIFSGADSVHASQIGVINVHDFKYYKSISLGQMVSMLCQVNKIQKMILM